MRIAIIGQQAFGKSVFEAFRARGDEVAVDFCAALGLAEGDRLNAAAAAPAPQEPTQQVVRHAKEPEPA